MRTVFARCMLFISSYSPLALIIGVLFFAEQRILALSFWIVGGAGLLFMLVYLFLAVPKISPTQYKVTARHAKGGDVMGYVASYIVPFVTFPLNGWQQTFSLLTFIFILGVIYINSEDMLRVNPVFNLLGYKLYEITVEHNEESYALITHRGVKRNDIIHVVRFGNGIFLERRK